MSQYVFCEINPNALTTILSPLSFRYVALTFNTGIYSDYISLSWYTCSKVVTVWVLGSLYLLMIIWLTSVFLYLCCIHRSSTLDKEMKSVSSQTEGAVTVITVGNPPNSANPNGVIVRHMNIPPSHMSSEQSLGKSSRYWDSVTNIALRSFTAKNTVSII